VVCHRWAGPPRRSLRPVLLTLRKFQLRPGFFPAQRSTQKLEALVLVSTCSDHAVEIPRSDHRQPSQPHRHFKKWIKSAWCFFGPAGQRPRNRGLLGVTHGQIGRPCGPKNPVNVVDRVDQVIAAVGQLHMYKHIAGHKTDSSVVDFLAAPNRSITSSVGTSTSSFGLNALCSATCADLLANLLSKFDQNTDPNTIFRHLNLVPCPCEWQQQLHLILLKPACPTTAGGEQKIGAHTNRRTAPLDQVCGIARITNFQEVPRAFNSARPGSSPKADNILARPPRIRIIHNRKDTAVRAARNETPLPW